MCLHNYLRTCDIQCPSDDGPYITSSFIDSEAYDGSVNQGQWREEVHTFNAMTDVTACHYRNNTNHAKLVRELYQSYFMTEQGCIPWQTEVVTRGCNPEI